MESRRVFFVAHLACNSLELCKQGCNIWWWIPFGRLFPSWKNYILVFPSLFWHFSEDHFPAFPFGGIWTRFLEDFQTTQKSCKKKKQQKQNGNNGCNQKRKQPKQERQNIHKTVYWLVKPTKFHKENQQLSLTKNERSYSFQQNNPLGKSGGQTRN